jgi:hypothetical protein
MRPNNFPGIFGNSMLSLPAQKKQEDLNFKGHNGKKRNRSQYQTDVNIDAWLKNIEGILSSSGIGEKCCKALRMFAQNPKARSFDFTPHQLAKLAGCNKTTIYRNIQKAVDSGLIVLVQPGDHSQRKAAVYRLSTIIKTFQEYQIATVEDVPATIEVHKKNPRFTRAGDASK